MTAPPSPDAPDPATLGKLQGTIGALGQRVADIGRRVDTAVRRLDQGEVDQIAARLTDLDTRFAVFAATVNDALDGAAPRGPAAPRWDTLDPDDYVTQLGALQDWVNKILIPVYVDGGGYTLASCWAQHPQAIWELGDVAMAWRRTYLRRPDLDLALEWHDRWLPGVMRRLADVTRECKLRHQPAPR